MKNTSTRQGRFDLVKGQHPRRGQRVLQGDEALSLRDVCRRIGISYSYGRQAEISTPRYDERWRVGQAPTGAAF